MDVQYVSYAGQELPNWSGSYSWTAEWDSQRRNIVGWIVTIKGASVVFGATETETYARVRAIVFALSQPKKLFVWQNDKSDSNSIVIAVNGNGTTSGQGIKAYQMDRRDGPKPDVVKVESITGGKAARITVEISAFIWPAIYGLIPGYDKYNPNYYSTTSTFGVNNPVDNAITNALEEISWTQNQTLDRNFSMTRNITGTLRIAPLYQTVDSRNNIISFLQNGPFWPSLPVNFYREAIDCTLSSDGLTWNIKIVDKQAWRTLPSPLTDGFATMDIAVTGGQIIKVLNCEFSAPNNVDKKVIFQFLVALIKNKFSAAFQTGSVPNEFITDLDLVNDEFNNRVACRVKSMQTAQNILASAFNSPSGDTVNNTPKGADSNFVAALFSDIRNVQSTPTDNWVPSNQFAYLGTMTGTAQLIPSTPLFADLHASTTASGVVSVGSFTQYASDVTSNTAYSTGTSTVTFSTSTNTSNPNDVTNKNYPYTYFHENTQYLCDYHIKAIPVMGKRTTSSYSPYAVQQTQAPEVTIISVGTARRINRPPDVPQPPLTDIDNVSSTLTIGDYSNGYVVNREIRQNTPRLMADGVTQEYGLSWSYKVIVPNAFNLIAAGPNGFPTMPAIYPHFPINPLLSGTVAPEWLQAPNQTAYIGTTNAQSTVNPDGTYAADTRYIS